MRLIATLALAALVLPGPVAANVDVDLRALDQLGPSKPAPKPPAKSAPPRPPERPAAAPPAPIIREAPPQAVETPAAAPAPAVIDVPPQPSAASAHLQGAAERPGDIPTLPTLVEQTAPAAPPPSAEKPDAEALGRVPFGPGAAELSPAGKAVLRGVAQRLAADDRLHLELVAYAGLDDPSLARRLSLARALAARAYLVDQGIRIQRIGLRPLGTPSDGSGDRIDLRLARH
jgi:outer membrane protein OmpA-like peptidoglycan-associated protein